jgi:hydroxypyruvate reductase
MSRNAEDQQVEGRLRRDLLDIYRTAAAECDAHRVTDKAFDLEDGHLWIRDQRFPIPEEGVIVFGAGKVSAIMAEPVVAKAGRFIRKGLISTLPHWVSCVPDFEFFGAGHPLPDAVGLAAARSMEKAAQALDGRYLVLFLLSGGASALLPLPPGGVPLEDKIRMTDLLLRCGAGIHEINCLRKHLSRIKGGNLAKMISPTPLITLSISDVPGDDPAAIGSGPTVPDPTTFSQCMAVIRKYGLEERLPDTVMHYLMRGARGVRPETPKPGDPVFSRNKFFIICSRRTLIEAARLRSAALGYHPFVLKEGDFSGAGDLARYHLKTLRERIDEWEGRVPLCLISAGEAAVRVTGSGKGGRNQAFILNLVEGLASMKGVCALSGATDGRDGPTEAAGAVAVPSSLGRARAAGLDPARFQARSDAFHFFEPLGDLLITGPGRTNVMDLRLLAFRPAAGAD